MEVRPGPLVARGRAADVHAAGPGLVLRRYRNRTQDAAPEARVMARAAAAGFPVPRVVEVAGPDLLLERVDGPTMIEDLSRRPWRLRAYAALLADLHLRLARIEAPPDLRAPLGDGLGLLHLDLHPGNVLMSPDGPVVIDWTNAARGPLAAGVADTWLVVGCARPEGAATAARLGQGLLTRRFLAVAGRDSAREQLRAAFARRDLDPNMSAIENARMRALVRRETGSVPK